jgi:hypothetical protein
MKRSIFRSTPPHPRVLPEMPVTLFVWFNKRLFFDVSSRLFTEKMLMYLSSLIAQPEVGSFSQVTTGLCVFSYCR